MTLRPAPAQRAPPAGRRAVGPHQPAGAARHGRRGRHERLRPRDQPAGWPPSASRSRCSPAPPAATCRPSSRSSPGVTVRHLTAGPYEGLGKEDLPSQLCALTSGVLRAEAAPRARLVRRRALALLAVRAGRLAGHRALGRPARAHRAHPRQGQEPRAGRRTTCPSRCAGWSARSRSSPPPTGSSPTPPTRPASSSTSTTPTPSRVVTVAPGVDLEHFRPGHRHRPPAPASVCRPTPSCCCSSGACSRSRRPTSCSGPPRGCSSRPGAARPHSSSRSSAGRAATGRTSPPRCATLAAALGPAGPLRAAGRTATGCATGTRRRRRRRPLAQRVVRAGRPRGAGLRHPGRRHRRRRAAHHRPRRRQRPARPRPRPRRLGRGPAPRAARSAGAVARRRRARRRLLLGRDRRRACCAPTATRCADAAAPLRRWRPPR